ncbi:hypothetical protein D3C81_828820 [compost metagenome]
MADRQCGVFVGTRGQGFVDEQMTRHDAHRIEGGFVDDAGLTQTVDQTVTHTLRGHADPHGFGLQAQARRHSAFPNDPVSPPTQPATFSSAS